MAREDRKTASLPDLPSRTLQTDDQGFYRLPSGLADDYPPEDASAETMNRDLLAAKDTGSRFLRVGIAWNGTEISPGVYDWSIWDRLFKLAEEHHVRILPYVCYSPPWSNHGKTDFWRTPPRDLKAFGKFMHAIAKRYRGRALSWELWNEPDLQNYWLGTEEQFHDMIAEGIHAVRSADPDAMVVLGGMAQPLEHPMFTNLLARSSFANLLDTFNIHGYNETWSPLTIEEYESLITQVKKRVDQATSQKDLWLAEFGYSDSRFKTNQASEYGIPIHFDYEHTPEYQAKALWKSHIMAASTNALSLMTWYRIKDLPPKTTVIGDMNNLHLGILTPSGDRKPSFFALKRYHELFYLPFRATQHSAVEVIAKGPIVVKSFELNNGDLIFTAWIRSVKPGEIKNPTGLQKDTRTGRLLLRPKPKAPPMTLEVIDLNGPRTPGDFPTRVDLKADQIWIGLFRKSVSITD